MRASEPNPRISLLLQRVTAIEAIVLLATGGGLFFPPAVIRELWPWTLMPFNAVFLGAVYLAALVPAAWLVLQGRWSPARVVVPMSAYFWPWPWGR